jgi:hypothetical protein
MRLAAAGEQAHDLRHVIAFEAALKELNDASKF